MFILTQRTTVASNSTYRILAAFATHDLALQAVEDLKKGPHMFTFKRSHEQIETFNDGFQVDVPSLSWCFQIVDVRLFPAAMDQMELENAVEDRAKGVLR